MKNCSLYAANKKIQQYYTRLTINIQSEERKNTERKEKVLWQRKAGKGILTGLRFSAFSAIIYYVLAFSNMLCINNASNLYIN